ncbi:hypothetical protein FA15DRAFT_600963, partial [Coprinopsis marcescibilis]
VVAHGELTLHELDPTPTALDQTVIHSGEYQGITPVSVNAAGATVYVGTRINSYHYVENANTTATQLSTPVAKEITFTADASRYYEAYPTTNSAGIVGEAVTDCTYLPDGLVSCNHRVEVVVEGERTTTVLDHHTTGRARPFATITDPDELNLPTEGVVEKDNSAGVSVRPGVVGLVSVALGLVVGAFII